MTRVNRRLVRVTAAKFRGDEIVIELYATAVFVRTKGSREGFPIPYTASTRLPPCAMPNA